jgi:hypothetical protein
MAQRYPLLRKPGKSHGREVGAGGLLEAKATQAVAQAVSISTLSFEDMV